MSFINKKPSQYYVDNNNFEAAYLALHHKGELKQRAEKAIANLKKCRVCPRDCEVDRLANEAAACKTGRYAQVSSYFPHQGEEDCLRGWRGSGTIFFSMCNLRCVFCQNFDVSQVRSGLTVSPPQLAAMMLELQESGCHNINFVTPEHVVPQILEALLIAVEAGLRLPLVYNTSSYDSLESLRLLDGIVDIYMPDFKLWEPKLTLHYLKAKDYTEMAQKAIKEMHRQVGLLKFDNTGLAKRGVLVRHLVMPGLIAETKQIFNFLAKEVGKGTYVNVMAQYYPAAKVGSTQYIEINRRLHPKEYHQAIEIAQRLGLRLDKRYKYEFGIGL